MNKSKRPKTFTVYGKSTMEVGLEITATSLPEAMEKASKLTVEDFVEVNGEYIDGDFRIIGVNELFLA